MKNIIVIGSGLAGSLICNDLASEANVTLLEHGEKDVISYPDTHFKSKKLAPCNTFCYSGGGGSNLWHNGLIPIGKEDVVSSKFLDILTAADPYTDKAASMLFYKGQYSNDYSEVVTEMNALADSLGSFKDGVDCLVYPNKYSKLNVVKNVEAYYSARDITFDSKDKTINTVRFNVAGTEFKLTADIIIISSGTFGTPQLVKKALESVHEPHRTAGKGLIDHPSGWAGKVKFSSSAAKSIKKLSSFKKDVFESCTGIRIKSDCGKYTCFAFLRPAFTMGNSLSIYKYKSLLGGSSGIERIKNALSFKIFHPDILVEVISHVLKIRVPTNTFNILVYFQQHQGSNSVDFENGQPVIDWDISKEELGIYNELLLKLDTCLSSIAKETNIQTPITADWLRSGAHHSGTISLGNDEPDMVDRDLKLNACKNVYVCDGSIIQEHSYANTGLTIGKLALRLCDKIREL